MKAKLIQDCEFEIVTDIENDEPVWGLPEFFKAGTVLEFDIVDHPEKFVGDKLVEDKTLWNIQFGDGTMAMGVSCEWFGLKVQDHHVFGPVTGTCIFCGISDEDDRIENGLCINGDYEK